MQSKIIVVKTTNDLLDLINHVEKYDQYTITLTKGKHSVDAASIVGVTALSILNTPVKIEYPKELLDFSKYLRKFDYENNFYKQY